MRVLTVGNMYPPHHLGGYEITWRSSVEHLRRLGHEVAVLTTDYRRPEVTEADTTGTHRELRWYWRDHEFPRIGLRAVRRLERHNADVLDHQLESFRPDVVCWWAMGGMSLALIERVRRRGLAAVGVVGDEWMGYGFQVDAWQRLARRLRLPGRPDLGRAGTWLFNSDYTRRRALELGLPADSARVAHPGIDPGLFKPAPARSWDWDLACVGRIDPRKGLMLAVEVLAELPAAKLRLAGSGDHAHEAELRARADALGVAERLTLREAPRAEVAGVYGGSDAVLFPVLWQEPWGLTPLEAMACGRPVVATGRGGSAEFLRHEHNCLIFDPDAGPAALAAALERLAGDADLRAQLRDHGLATAARYTEQAYNDQIAAALAEAADR